VVGWGGGDGAESARAIVVAADAQMLENKSSFCAARRIEINFFPPQFALCFGEQGADFPSFTLR
jgi:hypothetical protein